MKRRFVVGTMVMAAAMLAGGTVYAAPAAAAPVLKRAGYSKTNQVRFNLRNDLKTPIRLKAGEQELTLAPGQAVPVKLTVGDKIVAEETTPNYPAGTVLMVVSSALADSTLAIH